jgi:hypothetical protein
MHLHASWEALFASITAVNEAGDRKVAGFTGAMDLKASLGKKMTKLVQPFGLLLAANDKKGIAILHHPHNFGGTLLRPSNKVGCLVRVGPFAVPVVLDHDGALRSIAANVPPIAAIADCATVDDLAALPTAPANVDGDFVAAGGGDANEDDNGAPADGVQGGNRRQHGHHGNNAAVAGNAAPTGRRGNAVEGAAAGRSKGAAAGTTLPPSPLPLPTSTAISLPPAVATPTRMMMVPPPMESKAAIAANVGTAATMPPSQATPPHRTMRQCCQRRRRRQE